MVILLALVVTWPVGATGQEPEVIVIDGQSHALASAPLDAWLEAHPRALPRSDLVSSSLWRGYVGHWRLLEGRLLLERLDVPDPPAPESRGTRDASARRSLDLAAIFKATPPIHAGWYSGVLLVPLGEAVTTVHMGFASRYPRYLVIGVGGGEERCRTELDSEAFEALRDASYERHRATEAYRAALAQARASDAAPPWDEEDQDRFDYVRSADTDYLVADLPGCGKG
jgi:hypothetical protein